MRAECVLFDLDGTLLNTLEDLTDSCNAAMAQMGRAPFSPETIRSFVGDGVRVLCERMVGEEEAERALRLFKAHYSGNMSNKTRPYEGIVPMLEALERMGVRCAVVSNKYDSAARSCCERHLPGLLQTVVGEGNGVRKKPSPDGALMAMERLGARKEGTLYVGDSEVDVATAKNAGLRCVCVSWGFRPRETLRKAGAPVIADTPAELLAYIQGKD